MRSDLYRGFRKRIIIYAIISICVTFFVEVILSFLAESIVETVKMRGYRSAVITRNGIDPLVKVISIIVIGSIIFIICFFILMNSFLKQMKEIETGINEIAAGNLDTVLPVKGEDELSQISKCINSMTKEVKKSIEREREAEQSKNELIANVAHDLRTPLTSVIGYITLLRNNPNQDQKTTQKYLDVAYNKSKHLEKLIEEFFGFTRLNHQDMPMNLSELDLVQLLGQLIDEFYPSFENSHLTCELKSEQKSVMIEADGNLLARLFDNLINNAIKYGQDGKVIKVHVFLEEEYVVVQVINYGKVIPEEDLSHIFEKFYRVEQSRSSSTGGTGLGLAIAKDIVRMHDGKIEARSSLKGTIFQVSLKRKDA